MSLSELLKKYQNKKKNIQKNLQTIKSQLEIKIQEESIKALKIQNHRVNKIHKNQQNIENKMKIQNQLTSLLRINQKQWIEIYDKLNEALKEAGDLTHYAGYIYAQASQILNQGTVAQYLEQAQKQPLNNPPSQKQRIQIQQHPSSLQANIQTEHSNKYEEQLIL